MRTSFLTVGLFFAVLVLSPSVSRAQITLQAGAGGGAVVPFRDFGGSTVDYYDGTKYGLSVGYNVHAKGRLGFGGLRIVGEVGFTQLTNSGAGISPNQGRVELTENIVSVKVGPEYLFNLPFAPVKPYVGAHIAAHFFQGETKFQGLSRVPTGTINVETATRLGAGAGVGVVMSMGPLLSLDIGAQYDLMNLLLKEYKDANTGQRLDSYLALNDKADPAYDPASDKHIVGASRSIDAIMVTATVMIGL